MSNFEEQSFNKTFAIGQDVKQYAHYMNYNHQKISEKTLLHASKELLAALQDIGQKEFDIDAYGETSRKVFEFEEQEFQNSRLYRVLSLMIVAFVDLGLLDIE